MSGVAGAHTQGRARVVNWSKQEAQVIAATVNGDMALTGYCLTPDAERLTACWNALSGIPTEDIPTLLGEVRDIIESMAEIIDDQLDGDFPYTLEDARTLLAKLGSGS